MCKFLFHCFGLATLLGGAPAPPPTQSTVDSWLTATTTDRFRPAHAADAPLQVDFPKKDWMVLPASGSLVLALSSRKGDAVALVERAALRLVLERDDITDVFAQIELDAIRDRQPRASGFQTRVLDLGPRRLVAVEYTRFGVLGSERVRQYSVPIGKQLYRLSCISSTERFAHYATVFSHIAASFTATEQ